MHEKLMWKHNCSLTLTYDEQHLPKDRSLNYRDYQQFTRRLRTHLVRTLHLLPSASGLLHAPSAHLLSRKGSFRFYMGGEYGDDFGRPHYHAALFGLDFADRIYYMKSPAGFKLYESQTLHKIWGKGKALIGDLTFESAAYIARYIMKKRTGDGNKTHYEIIDLETGQIQLRKKEFNNMSRRPGIGAAWLEQYEADAYPQGKVVMNGHEVNAPRYYDKKWAEKEPDQWEKLQYERYKEGMKYVKERTDERLKVQEQVQAARTKTLKRELR